MMKIVSFSLISGIFFDFEQNIKISRRATEGAYFSLAIQAKPRSVVDSCRNLKTGFEGTLGATFSIACLTGIGYP